ncbi:MAG: ImmA/IrrE family metallo-endopeptidase [Pyrinomonadaceae bacterium]
MESHEPEDYARALLNHPDIQHSKDIEQIAAKLRLSIRDVDSAKFEGALVRIARSSEGIIALKRNFREAGRRRFTLAHEIGHFILPGHGQDECYCTSAQIESWRKDAVRRHEFEANRFASELLLPSKLLYPLVNAKELTLAMVTELALEFDTSLTATAVKSVEVTEECCAVVCSVGRKVKWVRKSENFHYFVPNTMLGNDAMAGGLFDSDSVRQAEGRVLAGSWIDDSKIDGRKEIWEESIAMPFYSMVLTILTV